MSQTETPTRPGIVGLHVGIGVSSAIAGDVDRDQPRMALPQRLRAEAGARRRSGRQILDEDVRLPEDAVQEGRILGLLDIRDEALLAAVEPNEIARQPEDRRVIAAREIALGPLDLDDARPGIRQPRRTVGRGHSLFQAEHEKPVES
jgi:hypothetical protein